jgi:uncharacterized FlaG/YvyC family protein
MSISSINNTSLNPGSYSSGLGPSQPVSADQRTLLEAVRSVNTAQLFGPDEILTFVRDRATARPVLRVVSKDTGDVIAQIPAENVLRMAEELNES